MKYFAYGSNMFEERLRSRIPSAVFHRVGLLRAHRVVFNKRGMDNSGKCNLENSGSLRDVVYGVVFFVDDADVPSLDEAEDGARGGYLRRTILVDIEDTSVEVESYFANPLFIDNSLLPFDWYHALVVAGALEHGIPQEYLDDIASTPNIRDSDEMRRERGLGALGSYREDFEAGRLTGSASCTVSRLTYIRHCRILRQ